MWRSVRQTPRREPEEGPAPLWAEACESLNVKRLFRGSLGWRFQRRASVNRDAMSDRGTAHRITRGVIILNLKTRCVRISRKATFHANDFFWLVDGLGKVIQKRAARGAIGGAVIAG